jgi:hypothetical protein
VTAAAESLDRAGVPNRIRWMDGDHDLHAHHPAELGGLLRDAVRDGLFE